MKWDCRFYTEIGESLKSYRKDFLAVKKHINKRKIYKKGTPKELAQILNSYDRKIKNIPIFSKETKTEYLKGIDLIFSHFHEEKKYGNPSKFYKKIEQMAIFYTLNN